VRRLGGVAAGVVSCLVLAAPVTADDASRGTPVRGMTVSSHGYGREWGSDAMRPTLERLRALGVNWIAIHPYAAIRADGGVEFEPMEPADPPPHLVRPIREAHALGLEVLVVPHLAHWRSPFSWRGAITFEREEHWRRFFRDYERFMLSVAQACREADALAVGSELDGTLAREAEWRRLIAGVRRRTRAHLTYGANWADYERVPFWDALDVIGIQAYFPVASRPSPSEPEIRAGWQRVRASVTAFARRQGRHVVFTELGYNQAFDAPVRPWAFHSDGDAAEPVARTCLRVALEAIEAEPLFIGAFLWKWFPEPRPMGRNFRLATPGMMQVIREAWVRPAVAQGR
jgi:hypothetical protein